MATHDPTFRFPIDEADAGAIHSRLNAFLVANGYTTSNDQAFPSHFRRGLSHASWWSSNMSRLGTRLRVDLDDSHLILDYEIAVTGQHLTDDDRRFWAQEAQRAFDFASGDNETPVDYRIQEEKRAEDVTGDYRSTAIWATAIVMTTIVVAGLVADWLGWL